MTSRVDLHLHSLSSDGTDLPEVISEKMAEAGIGVFALTDHDTVDGVEKAANTVPEGVRFIPGVEFSCRMDTGGCHILGYGCDMGSEAFLRALRAGERLRRDKLEARLEYLAGLGMALPPEDEARLRAMTSAGKPHIAEILVRDGRVRDKKEAMELLRRCPAGEGRLFAGEVIEAIRASGGVPVWAHPMGGEGERELTEGEFEERLRELVGYGLMGVECFYSKYRMDTCLRLEREAERRGLLISGGSDYHGGNKDILPGTLNADGVEIEARRLTVLGAVTA